LTKQAACHLDIGLIYSPVATPVAAPYAGPVAPNYCEFGRIAPNEYADDSVNNLLQIATNVKR